MGWQFADFNNDGKADLVTVNSNDDNDVAVVLGNGQGGFTRAPGSPFAVVRARTLLRLATSMPTASWTQSSPAPGFDRERCPRVPATP
jgi:hypothetical protein